MEDLNAYIDEQLAKYRPDRYAIDDDTWRQPIYAEVEKLVPEIDAKWFHAKQIVDQRERSATHKADALLREIGSSGQWPLDWMDYMNSPISSGDERVHLGAATAEDLDHRAIDERRWAAEDLDQWARRNVAFGLTHHDPALVNRRRSSIARFVTRFAACEGAEEIASQIRSYGVSNAYEAGMRATS